MYVEIKCVNKRRSNALKVTYPTNVSEHSNMSKWTAFKTQSQFPVNQNISFCKGKARQIGYCNLIEEVFPVMRPLKNYSML